jgi:lipopolysaccharide/colanic/teichoic acid biosynthesis glycosyltransferase
VPRLDSLPERIGPRPRRDLPEPDGERIAPRGRYARFGKPLFEGLLLAILVPLALLPLGLVALANLLQYRDPRQILFTQPRIGRRGRVFTIYKFRTMTDADRGAMESWESGTDRLRVTRLGRFLRNTHLDELPQLLNVLRGDMRLIGPRPEMIEIDRWARERIPGFARRLAVRPGISGLAQVTQGYAGCDERAYARKLRVDEHYLSHLTLRQDLVILVRTVLWMLLGKGSRWKHPAPRRTEGRSRSGAGRRDDRDGKGQANADGGTLAPVVVRRTGLRERALR